MSGKTVSVTLPFEPYRHQREAHGARKRFSVLVWHRRAGKSVFATLELILAAAACTRDRPRFGYVAPLLKQAKDVVWEYLKKFTRGIPGCHYNESELSVTLPNGALLRLYGADHPDSLRGLYFDGVVLDEVADMRPNVWGEIVRPTLTDRQGWALFIGTPKGINLFSERYYEAMKDPEWYADLRRASDTGIIPKEEIEQARRSMSAAQFAQEFDCDFAAAAANSLIRLDLVLAAQERTVEQRGYIYAPKILGVDCARQGSDRSVLQLRQGRVAFPPRIIRTPNLMDLCGFIIHLLREWGKATPINGLCVDMDGLGAGVGDRLRELGYLVSEVHGGATPRDPRKYLNRRAEMWGEMAEWLGLASIPDDAELAQELTAPTFKHNSNGQIVLESKDEMRKRGLPSPDKGDALAYTFAEAFTADARVIPAEPTSLAEMSGGTRYDTEWMPEGMR